VSDFTDLDLRIARLIDQVTPAARDALARKLASDLRKANAQRIRENVEPDGEAMAPRQPRKQGNALRERIGATALRREAMFARAGGAKFLRARATSEGAQIGFTGVREVLGISDGDRARLLDILAGHFGS
jgi:phage virion morphogenesis protein